MTATTTHPVVTESKGTAVRPFRVEIPKEDLEDLRRRFAATRWPERELVADQSQRRAVGNDAGTRALLAHAVRLPAETLNIVGPLTDPTAHGGKAEDAFHLVIPSIPGYGFSATPTTTGWDPAGIARAWTALMMRLGYTRFGAQGGDWGAIITDEMGSQAPAELLGIHSNMPGTVPPEISKALTSNVYGTGDPRPSGLSTDGSRAYDQLSFLFTNGIGYALKMGLHPQTLYGLADSPMALAAWMLDHDAQSYDDISSAFVDGNAVDGLTRDEVLDNITLTWLTNTGISSARIYWENKRGFFDVKGVKVPAAVSVFPRELYQSPRTWAEHAYPNLIYFNEVDRGNHFAAWQEPELFTTEVRAPFRPVR